MIKISWNKHVWHMKTINIVERQNEIQILLFLINIPVYKRLEVNQD